jgi:hypothetical protein
MGATFPPHLVLVARWALAADGSAGSDATRHVRCIANSGHAFNVADTDIAGSILRWGVKW